MENIPEDALVLKGHLTLPKDSGPERHKEVKESFILAIRRWAKRHGFLVEINAVIHITDPSNAHWDYHLWTTAGYWKLRPFFNKAWKKAGGEHSSIVEPDDLEATARYQGKPVVPDSKSKEAFLAAPRSVSGLNYQWSTRGFWCGKTINGIWQQLIREWKDGPVVLSKDEYALVRACPDCRKDGRTLCPVHQIKRNTTDTFDSEYKDDRYIPGYNLQADLDHFTRKLPTEAASGVSLSEYAARWGVSSSYMERVFAENPAIRKTSGEIVNGLHHSNGWYLDMSSVIRPSPVHQSKRNTTDTFQDNQLPEVRQLPEVNRSPLHQSKRNTTDTFGPPATTRTTVATSCLRTTVLHFTRLRETLPTLLDNMEV